MNDKNKYYGIYRGSVLNNVDPMQLGRIQVAVPDASGMTPSTWAMPSVPITGRQMGVFVVPQVGSGVWIQFEAGEADRPVWIGGWWRTAAEVPALAFSGGPGETNIVLQSTLRNAIVISDLSGPAGGIMLKSSGGRLSSSMTAASTSRTARASASPLWGQRLRSITAHW